MTHEWDVVGIGANSVDFVHLLPGYPQPFGSFAKMKIERQEILCGGQTATAMCACAKLGLRARYAGVTGTDENGRRVRQRARPPRHRSHRRHHPRRAEPVRGDSGRRNQRRSHRPVGSRRAADDARARHPGRSHRRRARAARGRRRSGGGDSRGGGGARAGVPTTSDIDRMTDRTQELIDAVSIPIFAEHVPGARLGRQRSRGCAARAAAAASSHAVRHARRARRDGARRRRHALRARVPSRGRRHDRRRRRLPRRLHLRACSAAGRPTRSCASPTPPPP